MGNEWAAMERRVEAGIKLQGRYFVCAPAEMKQLGGQEAARAFALWHGWMFVSHLNGQNYEFFETMPGQQLY